MEEQDYILFEDYISGELSKDEITTFESRLNSDTKFNQAFITYKELSGFLENKFKNEAESTSFKNNLKSISDAHFSKNEFNHEVKKVWIEFNIYKMAIAACVVLFLGIFMFNQFSNPSYEDYMTYDSVSLTVRGNQDELNTKAEAAFNSMNFNEAEDYFTQLLEEDDSNQELLLYKGVTLLEQNKFDEADALFGKLSQGKSAFKNKSTWYLALSKLKQKQYDSCMEILKTIPADVEDYKQVKKLLKKLD